MRFEVGAGIEKKQDDFVGEVMAQVSKGKQQDGDDGRRYPKALGFNRMQPKDPAPAGSFIVGYGR